MLKKPVGQIAFSFRPWRARHPALWSGVQAPEYGLTGTRYAPDVRLYLRSAPDLRPLPRLAVASSALLLALLPSFRSFSSDNYLHRFVPNVSLSVISSISPVRRQKKNTQPHFSLPRLYFKFRSFYPVFQKSIFRFTGQLKIPKRD